MSKILVLALGLSGASANIESYSHTVPALAFPRPENSHNPNRRTFTKSNNGSKNHANKRRYRRQDDNDDEPSVLSEASSMFPKARRDRQSQHRHRGLHSNSTTYSKRNNTPNISPRHRRYRNSKQNIHQQTFTVHKLAPPLSMTELPPLLDKDIMNDSEEDVENMDNKSETHENIPFVKNQEKVLSQTVLERNLEECVEYICGPLPVTYTNDPGTIEQWLCDNIETYKGANGSRNLKGQNSIEDFIFLGFDVESVPNVPWMKYRTPYTGPATIQLSTPYSALVVHLTRTTNNLETSSLPYCQPLRSVLTDPSIIKVGAGIDDDALELFRWNHEFKSRSRFDMGGVGSGPNRGRIGLQKLVRAVLGVEMRKTKKLAMSNWSKAPLSDNQLFYCARDAWAGAAIMKSLEQRCPLVFDRNLIGMLVNERERDVREVHMRATERKRAKTKGKEILYQYRQYAELLDNDSKSGSGGVDGSAMELKGIMPDVVKEEMYRLQTIIDETAPDPIPLFEADAIGLDFSFENDVGNNIKINRSDINN